jgi:hypothetical protein
MQSSSVQWHEPDSTRHPAGGGAAVGNGVGIRVGGAGVGASVGGSVVGGGVGCVAVVVVVVIAEGQIFQPDLVTEESDVHSISPDAWMPFGPDVPE